MGCDLCKWQTVQNLVKRVFYADSHWFAFLDAPYHTRGHAVLAAKPTKPKGAECPDKIEDMPDCLSVALKHVSKCLRERYKPEDILIACLRGGIPHIHFHLIPLWSEEGRSWRLNTRHEKGRLMTFLGYLEKRREDRFSGERLEKGWNEEQQRDFLADQLWGDVIRLREITGYKPDE